MSAPSAAGTNRAKLETLADFLLRLVTFFLYRVVVGKALQVSIPLLLTR